MNQYVNGIAAISLFAFAGLANAGTITDRDVFMEFDAGRIVTGELDTLSGGPPAIVHGVRVFGADMGEDLNPPGFADEPGFRAEGITPGTAFAFDILAQLGEWNGAGFDASALTLSIGPDLTNPALPFATTGTGFVPGFAFATADSSGEVHEHLGFQLNSPILGGSGIYLLELQLRSSGPDASLPFWIVFNNGADEADHDAAIAYVQDNYVPAPASAYALGALWMVRRSRRR